MGGKRTPPFKEYKAWSEAKFFGWLRGGLRRAFTKWPPKYEVVDLAKREIKKKRKGMGRFKYEYQCNVCNKWKTRKQVEVDHIHPCGSLKSYEDLVGFCSRLFVGVDKLQVICKPCHAVKTKHDAELRKAKEESNNEN